MKEKLSLFCKRLKKTTKTNDKNASFLFWKNSHMKTRPLKVLFIFSRCILLSWKLVSENMSCPPRFKKCNLDVIWWRVPTGPVDLVNQKKSLRKCITNGRTSKHLISEQSLCLQYVARSRMYFNLYSKNETCQQHKVMEEAMLKPTCFLLLSAPNKRLCHKDKLVSFSV